MANEQGWIDWGNFVCGVARAISDVQRLYTDLTKLNNLKTIVIDDPVRRAAVLEISGVHYLYSESWINTFYSKLNTLKTYLEENSYV